MKICLFDNIVYKIEGNECLRFVCDDCLKVTAADEL